MLETCMKLDACCMSCTTTLQASRATSDQLATSHHGFSHQQALSQSLLLTQVQNRAEEEQLDAILKELIEQSPTSRGPPTQGSVGTSANGVDTTLTWTSSQAGGNKKAVVSKHTHANPTHDSSLTSQVVRSREVMGDEERVVGGRITSHEDHCLHMPLYQENRKVHALAEDHQFDVTSAAYRKYLSEREIENEDHMTNHRRQHEASVDEAWLRGQRNKLKQIRSGSLSHLPPHHTTHPPTHTTIAEYRDSKGRRCRTIETETFSRRCETTRNQAAIVSSPATPTIPERTDVSRQAYLRNLG